MFITLEQAENQKINNPRNTILKDLQYVYSFPQPLCSAADSHHKRTLQEIPWLRIDHV